MWENMIGGTWMIFYLFIKINLFILICFIKFWLNDNGEVEPCSGDLSKAEKKINDGGSERIWLTKHECFFIFL
jgi:hypothetical protein